MEHIRNFLGAIYNRVALGVSFREQREIIETLEEEPLTRPSHHRYFIMIDDGPEREVTKAEFVHYERGSGFFNTMGQPAEPGTWGFGGWNAAENGFVQGRIERNSGDSK